MEDADATTVWGHPDGEGGILPAVASYVNEQCEDATQLLQETKDYLEQVKEPKVTYTASVIDLYAFGRSWEGVGVGDDVAIIDKGFSAEGVRLHGRVSQIERDLLTGDATVTFGTLTDTMADMWQSVNSALKSNSQQNALYDAAAGTSVSWLIQLQQALNAQFNAVGTYHVETFELGEIWSNVPLNPETGLPVKATADMWAINVNGRGQRLAAGLTSDGQWDWRTFFTGGMVTADVINAGTMKADRVRAGLLTDEKGNNFWDLTSGEFSLSAGAKLGDTSVEDLFSGLDELDKTMDGIAEDGIITEAEHAAVSKILQTVEKESEDLESEYNSLYNSSYLDAQFKAVLRTQYEAVFSANGTHGKLLLRIQNVLDTTTAEDLYDAMQLYEIAYSDYAASIKTYNSAARQASNMIEQKQAQDKVDALDDSLTQRDVFNRLTNNGATQGIYLSGGKVYINATYIETGIISDRYGRSTWNLNTGSLTTNYMTANNIDANGTFECGSASNLIRLASGEITGYEDGTQIGTIDFSAHMRNVSTGKLTTGLQLTGNQHIRITTPLISAAASSSESTTTTHAITKECTLHYISKIQDDGDGTITWWNATRSIDFVDGFCTVCNFD